MNELAGQCLGGYELEEEIGRGSMGMVYRGRQIALGREVAIKVLSRALARDASYVARFIREAQIIAGLNHPHIVQIFDAGQQNGLLYFVMEYVQGPTIASLLHLDGAIPQHLAAEYAAQIAEALDSAEYPEAQVLGERLHAASAEGLVYPSVRNSTGECVGLFYPDLASRVVQGRHFDYHWNGTRVDLFREPAKGKVYRIV